MDILWLVHDLRETVYVGIKYFFSPLDALTDRYDIRLSCKCNFSRHHQYCHSSMAQYHKCVKCAKIFSRPSELARHIRVHTGDKPYKCNRCPKTFSQPGNLTVHKRACHSEKRPFKCGKCHARFKRKFDLVSHETIHTGEKPFVCSECGDAFSRKYHLTRHMRIHTGVKPYKCGKCGRKFSTDSGLRNHEITHTTKRPFSCKICGKTYTQLSGLKKHHLIVHTGGILFDAIGRGVLRKKSASSGIKTGNKDGKHTGESCLMPLAVEF
ncbi:gastrula zinc finger protein XlCGF49.1-like [Xenia sp. Carnegie-2017]|uniref:gastrula zinc finger protein XlCGF49.1-like n=1 Tax=Xenia sp. Carnegie-2017 TaxID=2897299 RepID=UPI001F042C70|nr:gastrula zinc finger protein XlCGF49.1-like [Xenia sp. Carnegie-2017]